MSADSIVPINILNIITIGAIPVTDGRFSKGLGPVHMSSVHCNGDEMRFLDCSHGNGVGVSDCHHGRDAGVMCEGILNGFTNRFNAHCHID